MDFFPISWMNFGEMFPFEIYPRSAINQCQQKSGIINCAGSVVSLVQWLLDGNPRECTDFKVLCTEKISAGYLFGYLEKSSFNTVIQVLIWVLGLVNLLRRLPPSTRNLFRSVAIIYSPFSFAHTTSYKQLDRMNEINVFFEIISSLLNGQEHYSQLNIERGLFWRGLVKM